mgnify:CR=1 FL=1
MRAEFSKSALLALPLMVAVTAAAEAADGATAIEEIVVTAQRRSQNLQDVPIAVTALDGETLRVASISNIDEVATRTPGLVVTYTNPAEPQFYIRGIGSNLADESSVVVFVDDVYIGRGGGMNFDLFDLERVEVLRGPQGTLFGRNVVGGLIHVITEKPSHEPGMSLRLSAGNLDRLNLAGSVTGPLSDSMAGKLSVSSIKRDGYVRNTVSGNDLFDEDSLSVRGQLSIDAGDDVSVLLSAEGMRERRNGDPRKVLGEGDAFDISDPDPLVVEAREDGFQDRDLFGLSAKIDWTSPLGEMTSITAYREAEFSFFTDFLGVPVTPVTIGSLNRLDEDSYQFTQELRLASTAFDGRADWVGGLYYIRENTARDEFLQQDFDALTGGVPLGLSGQILFPQRNVTDGYAVFGQLTWHVDDRLDLTVGARQSWDRKSVDLEGIDLSQNGLPLLPPPLQAEYDVSDSERWSAFTPRFAASYDLTDQVMVYASASRGYKSGGYQGTPTDGVSAVIAFDPEFAWSYEAGIKSRFLNDRLQLNATAFHTDYTDLQVVQLVGGDRLVTGNAADAKIDGLELEWIALLSAGLEFSGSYGYLDAEFEEFLAPASSGGDMSGNSLTRAPEHKLNLALQYSHQLENVEVSARLDWRYQSEFFFDPRNRTAPAGGDRQGGYDLLDARVALATRDGAVEVAVWGKNLTDELYRNSVGVFEPFNQTFVAFGVPRTYGVSVTWNR